MKILFVVHDFLPKHLAGTELYTYNLARTLKESGHEVSIYTREYSYFEGEFTEQDTQYENIKVKTVFFNSPNEKFRLLRKIQLDFYNPLLEKHFKRHLEEIKPDVIHIQHLKGLSGSFIKVAKRKKIPTVLTLHDFWFMCDRIQLLTTSLKRCNGPVYGLKCPTCLIPNPDGQFVRLLYPLYATLYLIRTLYLKRLLKKADLIISPSNFLRNRFLEYGIPESQIIFSDNGLNTNLYKPAARNSNNTIKFAFIGSLMPHKGVHLLIEAFNKIKDCRAQLLVFGDPAYSPAYYEKLKQMATNLNIKFMGSFNNKRIYKIFAGIDALVVPSIWSENSPITMHEAALAGVPVLASNIGGMAELVERMENGLLFKVEDATDLYAKMKLLIDDPQLRKSLNGKAAQVKTIEENTRELEKIYSQLIRNKKLSEL